jgi:hypothetical protein
MPAKDSLLWTLLFTTNTDILSAARQKCFELYEKEFFPYNLSDDNGVYDIDLCELSRSLVFNACRSDLGMTRLAIMGLILTSYNVREYIRPFCDPEYFTHFLGVLDKFLCNYIMTDASLARTGVKFASPNRLVQYIQTFYLSGRV